MEEEMGNQKDLLSVEDVKEEEAEIQEIQLFLQITLELTDSQKASKGSDKDKMDLLKSPSLLIPLLLEEFTKTEKLYFTCN